MKGFQKYILDNHPDPDGLLGNVSVFEQMCKLAEGYKEQEAKNVGFTADDMERAYLNGKNDGIDSNIPFNIHYYKLK